MLLLIPSLLFAAALGYAAHRAGICTVSAVGEVLTSGTARTFLSFAKVVLWVVLINGVALAISPELYRPYEAYALSWGAVVGGFSFGLGAGLNGGCSFSTLSKLAQGELHLALTLPAFAAGAFCIAMLDVQFSPIAASVHVFDFNQLPIWLLGIGGIWAGYELFRLISASLQAGWWQSMSRKRYSLSASAAVIGIASGFLYLAHGRWAYSAQIIDHYTTPDPQPYLGSDAFFLLLALLAGAGASAVSNGTFHISFASERWLRHVSGGFLMGAGVWLVPGGNGKLILQDLPHLSIHALVAFLAMIFGIASFLMIHKVLFGTTEVVSCAGDECRIEKL